VTGGRGVDYHQVVGFGVRVRRSNWASSHTLPMLSSSRMPGVAMAKAWKSFVEPTAWPSGPVFTRRYSSIACWGSIEIANRSGASSTSS